MSKLCLKIEYDIVNNQLAIVENDFRTFEAFGILQAVLQVISNQWLSHEVLIDEEDVE